MNDRRYTHDPCHCGDPWCAGCNEQGCPRCGQPTQGTPTEGGYTWAVCEDCFHAECATNAEERSET